MRRAGRDPEALLYRAAVTGAFDPLALSGGERDPLATLAPDCREVPFGEGIGWELKPDARRKALERLTVETVGDYLSMNRAAKLKTDDFGAHMERALRGRRFSPKTASDLSLYSTALEFASLVEGLAVRGEKARMMRHRAASRAYDDSLHMVAPDVLYGRDAEYDALVSLMRKGEVPEPYARNGGRGSVTTPPILVITGVGGVGKSALVAKYALNTRRFAGNGLVLLDFDRPLLRGGDPLEMLFEFTRQLSGMRRDLVAPLSALRMRMRRHARTLSDTESYDDRQSLVHRGFAQLGMIAQEQGILDRPIILILDTFEEVIDRRSEAVDLVFGWIDMLRETAGLEGLRVVISGRAAPHEAVGSQAGQTPPPEESVAQSYAGLIVLGDLAEAPSVRLLHARGVPSRRALSVFERYGGNPLVLFIIARIHREEGDAGLDELLDVAKGKTRYSGEMAQRFLYRRILDRIDDERIRALADPGLVLRRVTPDLILNVLSTPCGLDIDGPDEARVLFDALRAKVWLVERDIAGVVRHRLDLRRLMLKPLMDEQTTLALIIHAAAAVYYTRHADPHLSVEEQDLETLYHRAFLPQTLPAAVVEAVPSLMEFVAGPLASVPIGEASAALLAITVGNDLDALPAAARAAIKLHSNRAPILDAEELETLDDDALDRVRTMRQRDLLRSGASMAARQKGRDDRVIPAKGRTVSTTVRHRPESSPAFPQAQALEVLEAPENEDIQAAFEIGDFDFLCKSAGAVFRQIPASMSPEGPTQDIAFSAWWRCAFAMRAMNRLPNDWNGIAATLTDKALEREKLPLRPSGSIDTSLGAITVTMFAVLGDRARASNLLDTLVRKRSVKRYTEPVLSRFGAIRCLRILDPLLPDDRWHGGETVQVVGSLYRYTSLMLMREQLPEHHAMYPENPPSGGPVRVPMATLDDITSAMARVTLPATLRPRLVLPELHSLLRNSLSDALDTGLDLAACVERLDRRRIWPVELEGDRLAGSRRARHGILPAVIDMADRCDVLLDLIETAAEVAPDAMAPALLMLRTCESLLNGDVQRALTPPFAGQ